MQYVHGVVVEFQVQWRMKAYLKNKQTNDKDIK